MLLMGWVFFCMGHTLQLGKLKAYDLGPVKAALACVSKAANHFCRSSKATYSLKEKQNLLGLKLHMLKRSCVTRWGYISNACMVHRSTASCVCCTFVG